jgi:acetyl esterase/lipase
VLVAILVATASSAASAAPNTADQLEDTLPPVDPAITEVDEVYRRAGGTDLHVLVQRPPHAGGDAPAVVLVHGGGWGSGSAADMTPWAELLADVGWVAFSIDYRLASEAEPSWPEALADVRAGVEWVHANAGRFGADPARLALFGESAGAHLATLVAVDGTGGAARPVAVAAWSPPLDLAELVPPAEGGPVPGCTANAACEQFWSMGWARWFLGCDPATCADAYADASPSGRAGTTTTPLWLANSTDELVPLAPAERFAAELAEAGVDHELVVIPGRGHAHGYGQRVWNTMVPWLAERLGVEAPPPAPFPGDAGDRGGVLAAVVVAGLGLLATGVVLALRQERRGAADDGRGP